MLLAGAATGGQQLTSPITAAAKGQLRPAVLREKASNGTTTVKTAPFFSAGLINAAGSADAREEGSDYGSGAEIDPFPDLGQSQGTLGCRKRNTNGNVRANQDCTFRRQAEEEIVYNPANPKNLLAAQNDSRVGFNQCGIDWSTDNGEHWGDLLPPDRQRLNDPASEEPTGSDPTRHTLRGGPGMGHTYDAFSDPTVAFDSQGRGYFSCLGFDVGSNASLVYVTQSPKGADGAFFFNLAAAGRNWIVADDNSETVFHDKQFIVADRYTQSPNRDNVYVTWTVFFFDTQRCGGYCSSPIYGSMSTNGGLRWSTPEEISGTSSLCFFGNFFDPGRPANACDFDQGSDPEVLPNGDLVVVFINGNTAANNPNAQQLAVHCHPTGSSPTGTAHLNCADPVRPARRAGQRLRLRRCGRNRRQRTVQVQGLSPVFAAPDGAQAGFNGDYSGLTITGDSECHPVWSDTRNADPYTPANGVVHDEDIFTDKLGCPNGKAKTGPGKIGKGDDDDDK